jgi:RNase P subunit RPR2
MKRKFRLKETNTRNIGRVFTADGKVDSELKTKFNEKAKKATEKVVVKFVPANPTRYCKNCKKSKPFTHFKQENSFRLTTLCRECQDENRNKNKNRQKIVSLQNKIEATKKYYKDGEKIIVYNTEDTDARPHTLTEAEKQATLNEELTKIKRQLEELKEGE